METRAHTRFAIREGVAVWIAIALTLLAVLVTYSRFPAETYYHVSDEGIRGGLGQAVVVANYPMSFVAIALVGVAMARLWSTATVGGRAMTGAAALAGIVLCAVTSVSVDQADLDVRPINILPAAGVLLALGLTVAATRAGGIGGWRPWRPVDWLSLVAGGIAVLAGLPHIFAQLGIYTADIPLLKRIFMSRGVEDGVEIHYVHVGNHHGFSGLFMMLAGLALARVIVDAREPWIRWLFTWYVSLLTIYGATNFVQDSWGEQVVKRGWSDHEIPGMLRPALTIDWLYVAIAVVFFWLVYFVIAPRQARRGMVTGGRAGAGARQGTAMSLTP